MPQANGTGDGHSKPQPDHLPSTVTDERAPVRLASRTMHRYPLGRAHELDVDVPINPALQKLATNLIDHRFPFALFATSKVMAGQDVRRDRFPDQRRLAVESRRRRDSSIERDEAHLPLVGVGARCCPRRVARRGEQERFLLIGTGLEPQKLAEHCAAEP